MPLRRLTKFSKIELEKEQSELRARRSRSSTRSSATTTLLRKVVSDELAEVAKTYGTPRRTVLLESAGTAVTAAAAPLEVADDPCFALPVLHRPARPHRHRRAARRRAAAAPTTTWSSPRSRTTARGEVGVLTSAAAGCSSSACSTCPRCPPRPTTRNLQGGLPGQRAPLAGARRAGAGADRARRPTGPGLALGTRDGVVKRVNPEVLGQRRVGGDPAQGRRRGRRRGRAGHRRRDALLRHHRRPAAALRRRQRPAAGPLRRRHRRHPARRRRAGRSGSARSTPPTPSWSPSSGSVDRAARHRAGRGQGHAVHASTPPRAAPPAACAATGSSRARTPWSSPGPAPRRPGPRPPAAPRSTCPRPTGRRDGSGVRRAASRSPPCAGPGRGPAARSADRVWKADRHAAATRLAAAAALAVLAAARPVRWRPAPACSDDDEAGGDDDASARGGAGRGQEDPRRDQRRQRSR